MISIPDIPDDPGFDDDRILPDHKAYKWLCEWCRTQVRPGYFYCWRHESLERLLDYYGASLSDTYIPYNNMRARSMTTAQVLAQAALSLVYEPIMPPAAYLLGGDGTPHARDARRIRSLAGWDT